MSEFQIIALISGLVAVIIILAVYAGIIKKRGTQLNHDENNAEAAALSGLSANNLQGTAGGLNSDVIAAIASAVYYLYGSEKIKIKSIKPAASVRSVWGSAGVSELNQRF